MLFRCPRCKKRHWTPAGRVQCGVNHVIEDARQASQLIRNAREKADELRQHQKRLKIREREQKHPAHASDIADTSSPEERLRSDFFSFDPPIGSLIYHGGDSDRYAMFRSCDNDISHGHDSLSNDNDSEGGCNDSD